MRECGACGEGDNLDDERFCMSCGADMDGAAPAAPEAGQEPAHGGGDPACEGPSTGGESPGAGNGGTGGGGWDDSGGPGAEGPPAPGRLVIGGDTVATVGRSYRLVGRADLRAHTKGDPDLISRSHFTVFMAGPRHVICDGPTPVQDRPSGGGTRLNGKRLDGEAELRPGDKVAVSDVEMEFEA